MKNHEWDALIRQAFDEAEVGDGKVIGDLRETGADTSRVLGELGSLKADLRSLADVPECQISTDRMRQYVLGGSSAVVKGRSDRPKFLWWVPSLAGATCAAFAIFLMQGGGPASSVPANDPTAVAALTGDSSVPAGSALSESSASARALGSALSESTRERLLARATEEPQVVDVLSETRVRPTRRPSNRTQSVASANTTSDTVVASGMEMAMKAAPADPAVSSDSAAMRTGFQPEASPAQAFEVNEDDDSIVVMVEETIPGTRARTAVEVDKDNVVFGG